jgi:hypothetical protein
MRQGEWSVALSLAVHDQWYHALGSRVQGFSPALLHKVSCQPPVTLRQLRTEVQRQDELSDLASKALFPLVVCDKAKIYPCCPAKQKKDPDPQDQHPVIHNFCKNQGKDRGDVLIRGLWALVTDCIIDVPITNVDANANLSKDPNKVLSTHEREKKKKKYLEP